MVDVGAFCIDRYEASMVDTRHGQSLSPYYPPDPRLLRLVRDYWAMARLEIGDAAARAMPLPDLPLVQREGRFEPRAVSRAGVVPQAYVSYHNFPTAPASCRASATCFVPCIRRQYCTTTRRSGTAIRGST
jgi:hypothetical protein